MTVMTLLPVGWLAAGVLVAMAVALVVFSPRLVHNRHRRPK